ncbi:MAG: phosphatase PAP2 family protein [Chloroflexota bacterium]
MSNLPDSIAAPPLRVTSKRNHHLGDFRSPVLLGKWPLIGLLLVLFGSGLFLVLSISLQTHAPIMQTDQQISNSIHALALQSSPLMVDIMIFGFYLGEHVIIGIGFVLVVYFLYKRFWPELAMIVIAWGGEGGIWLLLAQHFNRTRPHFDKSVWHLITAPGYPSGHSFAALMCFGLLAYFLVPKIPSRQLKVAVIAITILLVLYVGFSRIFLGDHYPTDVLAGYSLGIAWSALVYTSVEVLAQRTHKRKAKSFNPPEVVAKI